MIGPNAVPIAPAIANVPKIDPKSLEPKKCPAISGSSANWPPMEKPNTTVKTHTSGMDLASSIQKKECILAIGRVIKYMVRGITSIFMGRHSKG